MIHRYYFTNHCVFRPGVHLLAVLALFGVIGTAIGASPTVTLGPTSVTYNEGGSAVLLDNAAAVADTDDDIVSITVRFSATGYVNGKDTLTGVSAGTVTVGGFNAGTRTLTLSSSVAGGETAANFRGALRTVRYNNTGGDHPVDGNRTVTITVTDNAGDTGTDSITVDVAATNDPPVNTAAPSISAAFSDPDLVLSATSGTWSDPEGATFSFSYQWYEDADGETDDAISANAAVIAGATQSSYTVPVSRYGKYFFCRVSATDTGSPLPAAIGTADTAYTDAAADEDADNLVTFIEDPDLDGNIAGDINNDRILNDGEIWTETNPLNQDSDLDGLNDGIEDANRNGQLNALESSPVNPDSDADGLLDGEEDANHDGQIAGDTSNDRTGFPGESWTETDPLNGDTDGDGILDGDEDVDSNGLIAGDTNGNRVMEDAEMWTETNPLNSDTDADGIVDGTDGRWISGTSYAWNVDLDNDNFINALDRDSDGDALLDNSEHSGLPTTNGDGNGDYVVNNGETWINTSAYAFDSDGDTMPDNWELQYGLDPLDPSDGAADLDGGSLSNANEYAKERDPTNAADDFAPDTQPEKVAFAEKIGVPQGDLTGKDIVLTKMIGTGDGASYFAGNFSPKAQFSDTTSVLAVDDNPDHNGFVAAIANDRTWPWAVRLFSDTSVHVNGMAVFGDFLYAVGWVNFDTANFDYSNPAGGSSTIASQPGGNIDKGFILKFNRDDGSLIEQYVATTRSRFNDVAVDDNGVYICGKYWSNTLSIHSRSSRSPSGTADIFVARLDNTLATCNWLNSGGGSISEHRDNANAITLDASGNAYVTGSVHGRRTYSVVQGPGECFWNNYCEEISGPSDTTANFVDSAVSGMLTGKWTRSIAYDRCACASHNNNAERTEYDANRGLFIGKFRESDGRLLAKNHDLTADSEGRAIVQVGGNIYVGGSANGVMEVTGDTRASFGSRYGFIVRLDEDLDAKKIIAVNGTGGGDIVSVLATAPGDNNTILAGGRYENPAGTFAQDEAGEDIVLNTSGRPHIFVSNVDVSMSGLKWEWVETTSTHNVTPPATVDIRGISYHTDSQRIFYGGVFYGLNNQSELTFGGAATELILGHVPSTSASASGAGDGTTSFLSAFNIDGTQLDMVLLEIVSERGDQFVSPGIGDFYYLFGSDIIVTWPYRIYPPPEEVLFASGTHDGANSSMALEDSGQNFTIHVRDGQWLTKMPDINDTSTWTSAPITDVTATSLTHDGGFTFNSGDAFKVTLKNPLLTTMVIADQASSESGTEPYEARHTAMGYTLGDGALHEDGSRFQFTIQHYTRLEIKWRTDYKLEVDAVVDLPDPDTITSEALRTLGNPNPGIGVHWIAKADEVSLLIDGKADITRTNESGARYLLESYDATGVVPDNPGFTPSTSRIQLAFPGGQDFFVMNEPGTLTYHWIKQYRVQVSTLNADQTDMPLIVHFPNKDAAQENISANQIMSKGSGEFYFSHDAKVWIMSRETDPGNNATLTGWKLAGGHFPFRQFPSQQQGSGTDIQPYAPVEEFVDPDDNQTYRYNAFKISSFTEPTTVSWSYGDTIHTMNTALGDFVAPPAALVNQLVQPDVRGVDVPPGSTVNDMFIWDDVDNRYFPLRDGTVLLDWESAADPAVTVVLQVTSGFPGESIPIYGDNPDRVTETIHATDISFANTNPDEIRSDGFFDFTTLAWQAGDQITVSGSTGNDGTYTIATVAFDKIQLEAGDTLTTEAAGAAVSIENVSATLIGIEEEQKDTDDAIIGSYFHGVFTVPNPDPHFRHVANTPPVDLDPSTTDEHALVGSKFYFRRGQQVTDGGVDSDPFSSENDPPENDLSSAGDDAAVSTAGTFTSGAAGKSVIVFSQSTTTGIAAVGDPTKERIIVRVVSTKVYDDDIDWDGNADLLERFTDEFDAAHTFEIGTKLRFNGADKGYVLFDGNSNYNSDIYSRDIAAGPIIPVNRVYYADVADAGIDTTKDLVVVWYETNQDIEWPFQSALYRRFHYPSVAPSAGIPTTKKRIVIASRLGTEGLDTADNRQFSFDPDLYQNVSIYNQPDKNAPGYNPNEEHALIAPSFAFATSANPPATAYALRNDLNHTTFNSTYTSDPFVLVQYFDVGAEEFRMSVYDVEVDDVNTSDPLANQPVHEDAGSPGGATVDEDYIFRYWVKAGEPLFAPYPLNLVIGINPCTEKTDPIEPLMGNYYSDDGTQRTWWEDHRGQGWIVSGDGVVFARWFYPLRSDFWYDIDNNGDSSIDGISDCIPWLPTTDPLGSGDYTPAPRDADASNKNRPVRIEVPTVWPPNLPILKAGETLTYSGGENRADNPAAEGLPGVIGWAAGEVVYDHRNPKMDPLTNASYQADWTIRLCAPLSERRVSFRDDPGTTDVETDVPTELQPASGNVTVVGVDYLFDELSASLKRRVFYDSITKELGIRGILNDKIIGDSDLTASPGASYILEPNILTADERDLLQGLDEVANSAWDLTVQALYELTQNPTDLDTAAFTDVNSEPAYLVGLGPYVDPVSLALDDTRSLPFRGLGPGLAVIPNQQFLDPNSGLADDFVSYVTLAENNHESLGAAPVALHIFKIERDRRFRGNVKLVFSDNAFDEKIVLRHTGDFGTHTGDLIYQWFIREEDGTEQPLPLATSPDAWQLFSKSGLGKFQVSFEGTGPMILQDNLVFVRYAHKDEINTDAEAVAGTVDWVGSKWDTYFADRDYELDDGTVFTARGAWAGAGNSPDVDGKFRPQLIPGWVKRVLDAINPYEARINDFTNNESPASYVSMIQQFGPAYEGAVALNPDKNVIENHGLIELYQTVQNRAMDLSIDLSLPVNTRGVINAILLAATRISEFYSILGNEAYSDARDPTIGIGTDDVAVGSLASSLFAFQNQVPSLLDEELALLRGVDDTFGRPVYNRFFWNFTKSQGEAAYASSYNISDTNNDGFVNEADAMKLYPQGHGDAWGHYLTALRGHYDLLRHPYFNWISRSEFYVLQDIVIDVDFLDERRFAEAAAGKARVGAETVNLTYRASYVEDPDGQWQGYKDTDTDRAWGVHGWAKRAGQGAFFDWVTANAILPAEAPEGKEGIAKIDRTTVTDLTEIATQLSAIQGQYDNANEGLNPLGLEPNAVPFDIDPARVDPTVNPNQATHFVQIYERALKALKNAKAVFDYANEHNHRLRQAAESAEDHLERAIEQDLAFRNRLIEVFGTPYSGTVGPGEPYPEGYDGPDTMLHMYIGRTEIDTDPGPGYAGDRFEVTWATEIPSQIQATFPFDSVGWSDFNADGDGDLTAFTNAILPYNANTTGANDSGDPEPGAFPLENPEIVNIQLPITAATYAFIAEDDWGQRSSIGRLQRVLGEMILAQATVESDIKRYQIAVASLNAMWENFQAKAELGKQGIEGKELLQNLQFANSVFFTVTDTIIRLLGYLKKDVTELVTVGEDAIPDPLVVGTSNTVPTASLAVPVIKSTGFATGKIFTVIQEVNQVLKDAAALTLMRIEQDKEIVGLKRDLSGDLIEQLTEILTSLGDEKVEGIQVLKSAEHLQQLAGKYRTTLEEGIRLLEERANWNKKLAAAVQQDRYADMALRVSRNDALEKYLAAYDLAARYTYLAAKAYDYETNLDPDDPGSAQPLLTDIVRARGIGQLSGDTPIAGPGGLADVLARMKANFDVLAPQLGFNNPQIEAGRFSLRRELFRINAGSGSDPNWRQTLETHRVEDLWQLAEFRRHCRPFAAFTGEPEPGIVIPFSSNIISRLNFFGWPLGGADHAYDPSRFATKVRSVGIWFDNYSNATLAQTPRVYLVPVGTDVMYVPTSGDLQNRQWNVVDQRIPVPFPTTSQHLSNVNWIPAVDSLNGPFGEIRRHSSFRAHLDTGNVELTQMTTDSRLIGRSVWNTRWLLIIPGASLNFDPDDGLDAFIHGDTISGAFPIQRDGDGVRDILLAFLTYSHSGN